MILKTWENVVRLSKIHVKLLNTIKLFYRPTGTIANFLRTEIGNIHIFFFFFFALCTVVYVK